MNNNNAAQYMENVSSVVFLRAPAKVNLSLHVLGRREDGYHDLVTRMQKIALYDNIEMSLTKEVGISCSCSDTSLPVDRRNLAVRAVETYLKHSKRLKNVGVRLVIEKNIPIAAGLGGGSSDAGTVLRGLNELCRDEFTEQQLIEMATPIGADVPFFASKMDSVQAEGIGEILYPVESTSEFVFVVVNPGFAVSTKEIFENLSLTSKSQKSILTRPLRERQMHLPVADMHNDLEEVTCRMYPQLQDLIEKLKSLGAVVAMMSGSGPTVFGLFGGREDQGKYSYIRDELSHEYGRKIFVVKAT